MSSSPDIAWEARCLLRSTRAAVLATQSAGQPYAALVTPAVLPDASILLLLSGLSEHTRQLRVDPRCAVLLSGPATDANPQTAPRLTVNGHAAPEHDPVLKDRWLRMHPYATVYAGLPDFTPWRIQPTSGHYIAGFARTARFAASQLRPEEANWAAIAQAEQSIITHCNDRHRQALDDIVRAGRPGASPGWHMVAVDTDGFDLAQQNQVHRIHWSAPVSDAMQVGGELMRLAQTARQSPGRQAAPI